MELGSLPLYYFPSQYFWGKYKFWINHWPLALKKSRTLALKLPKNESNNLQLLNFPPRKPGAGRRLWCSARRRSELSSRDTQSKADKENMEKNKHLAGKCQATGHGTWECPLPALLIALWHLSDNEPPAPGEMHRPDVVPLGSEQGVTSCCTSATLTISRTAHTSHMDPTPGAEWGYRLLQAKLLNASIWWRFSHKVDFFFL